MLSRFFPEQETKRSFGLRHLCLVHEVLTRECCLDKTEVYIKIVKIFPKPGGWA